MRVWDWQLDQAPSIREEVGRGRRARLAAAAGTSGVLRVGASLPIVRSTAAGDAARRLGAVADRQRSVQVPPARAFDGRVADGAVPLDAIVLIESTLRGESSLDPIGPADLSRRVAAMVVHEWLDLGSTLLAHRFAFPDRETPSLAMLETRLEAAMRTAFAGAPACWLRHPQPRSGARDPVVAGAHHGPAEDLPRTGPSTTLCRRYPVRSLVGRHTWGSDANSTRTERAR
jgi:hypothetical protein